FEDNPTENNKETVERFVEETFLSSPTPFFNKTTKAKKLLFSGPTVQDSEDGAGLSSRIDPSKGKIKGKISSGTEFTQGSAISQKEFPEIPIISETELELSMSNSKRYKSHSEGSNRHIHEPVQEVLHVVQGQGLGDFTTDPPRSDELLAYPEESSQRGGNKRYSNG
ncbi:hypothetical protein O181_133768, partial [Austropuccinia psidii MF-1]|nr:hypothetical protein [Austropuccinia psidii MF-1]